MEEWLMEQSVSISLISLLCSQHSGQGVRVTVKWFFLFQGERKLDTEKKKKKTALRTLKYKIILPEWTGKVLWRRHSRPWTCRPFIFIHHPFICAFVSLEDKMCLSERRFLNNGRLENQVFLKYMDLWKEMCQVTPTHNSFDSLHLRYFTAVRLKKSIQRCILFYILLKKKNKLQLHYATTLFEFFLIEV